MQVLVVIAHPLESSLCHALAHGAIDTLAAAGHQVRVEDLYGSGFAPALSAGEAFAAALQHAFLEGSTAPDVLVGYRRLDLPGAP